MRSARAATSNSDPPAAGILERVARDLRDRRRDPGLLLAVEAEQRGDLPGALAREHDVLLGPDLGREDRGGHGRSTSRPATTVTSSRPRAKSR